MVIIRKSTIVHPANETPKIKMWNSNLDLVMACNHTPFVYFYRFNGATNFFDPNVMKDALSKVLVAYYPVGGRLKEDKDGRTEIDCQGQGVLFVEAEYDGVLDDLGDFAPTTKFRELVPTVDYSLGIGSYPLMVSQVTYFKCGGVSLAVAMHHQLADGASHVQFVNAWSDLARGLDLTKQPFLDRTLLRAQESSHPIFEHVEYHLTPKKSSYVAPSSELVTRVFKLSREQLNVLKAKSKENGNTNNYTSFETLTGHIWKCVCKARGLPNDQETVLCVYVNARRRHHPPLPHEYFGNVVLSPFSIAISGEIQSNPSWYAASKIHDTLIKINNDYLNSALNYLELQPDLQAVCVANVESYRCPNIGITSLVNFPVHDADFGWGRPIFMGPALVGLDDCVYLLPGPVNDGSLIIVIELHDEHIKLFSKFFNESFMKEG